MTKEISKVLIIGSGPIVIGQAAEFDYAGTQACKSLKEEGVEVVLVNSNPATIMTDLDVADKVYIEPLIPEIIEKIIISVQSQQQYYNAEQDLGKFERVTEGQVIIIIIFITR